MADFGGLQDYTTPDGRTLRLPPQLAAGFSQSLTPVQAPAVDEPRAAPVDASLMQAPPVLPEPTALQSVPDRQPVAPEQNAPDFQAPMPGTPMPAPQKAPGPASTAAGAPTAPGRLTQRMLQQGTAADAANLELDALDQQRAAQEKAAQAEADTYTKQGHALEDRNARVNQILEERARVAEANNAALAAKQQEYERDAKALAAKKIDRSVDHPIIGAISLAASVIGSALSGGNPNAGLDLLMKQIDRKVDGQMQDLKIGQENLALKRQGLADMRAANADRLAEYDKRKLAAIEQAGMTIEQIKAASGSEEAKARLGLIQAGLLKERAGVIGGAMTREQARIAAEQARKDQLQHQRDQLGLGYAQLHRQSVNDDRNYDLARAKLALDQQQLGLEAEKLAAKGKADEAKMLREKGIGGAAEVVRDAQGNIVADKDGTPQTKYTTLKQRDGSAWIPNGSDAAIDKLRNQKAAADNLIGIIDDVQRMGPEWLSDRANSDKLQKMKALWAAAKLETKDFKELGVIAGPDMDLIEDFLGTGDPTRFKDSKAGIGQARKNILNGLNAKLRAHGFDGNYSPKDLGTLDGARTSPLDESSKDALVTPNKLSQGRVEQELGVNPNQPMGMRLQEMQTKLREAGGILPSVRAMLDAHARAATGSDTKARDNSLKWLEKAANESADPAIRSYATDILTNKVLGDVARPRPADAAPAQGAP